MRNIPLSVYLSFPSPNYEDPVTRGNALVIVNAVLISLVFIAVLLRLYTRIVIKRWFGSDDFFIIPSSIATVGLCAVVMLANSKYGWNRHVWDIPFTLFTPALKVAFIAKLLFVYAATFIRCSLLCFYYRLSHDSPIQWFRWAVHITMGFNISICIAFTLLGVLQCRPVEAYWIFPPPVGSQCMDEGRATLAVGIINSVADLVVTLLPVPIILSLQMPRRQRIGVLVLLSLGLIVTIAGVVRTYFIYKGLMNSYDETWETYSLWVAAAVEIDLGVLCACAPALRPLLNRSIQAVSTAFGSSKASSRSKASQSSSMSKRSKPSAGSERLPDRDERRWPNNIKMTTTFELSVLDNGKRSRQKEGLEESEASYGQFTRSIRPRDSNEIPLLPGCAGSGEQHDLRLVAASTEVSAAPPRERVRSP